MVLIVPLSTNTTTTNSTNSTNSTITFPNAHKIEFQVDLRVNHEILSFVDQVLHFSLRHVMISN